MSDVRFSFDLGTNSIGWAVLNLDKNGNPNSIAGMGSRIFSDGRNPKDKTSLAVARRSARLMRRQRDRKLQRMKNIFNYLVLLDLLPTQAEEQESVKNIDPLKARAEAVRGANISNYELGRAIYHLSRKRGFQSNRKDLTKKSDTKLTGVMEELRNKLNQEKALSYGDFLYNRIRNGLSTIATVETGFYPTRDILKDEFDKIVQAQKDSKPIKDDQWAKLRNLIFYQRPLRPIETGKCSIYPNKQRGFQYLASYEIYRLFGELTNLRWLSDDYSEEKMSLEQIKMCLEHFKASKTITYKAIKKVIGIPEMIPFTIEKSTGRDKIKGCDTNAYFADKKKGILKSRWFDFDLEDQDKLAEVFFEEDEKLQEKLKELIFLNDEDVNYLVDAEVPNFSDSTTAFSQEAMRKILEICLVSGETQQTAIHNLRQNETLQRNDDLLGYYGESIPETVVPISEHNKKHLQSINNDEKVFGKIANPTVHIGLNQLRKVVNELIQRFGKPESIHLEFARDLRMSRDQKIRHAKSQRENEARNAKAREFIKEHGLKPSSYSMERVKLWFEMENRNSCFCVYTGQPISQHMVLTEKVEVDHILPFSQTLDDSLSNKVLVLAEANRVKGNRTPFQAWKDKEEEWEAILARASEFHWSKYRRFFPNALQDYLKDNDFIARQLTDTSYLSKVAQKYLSTIIERSKIVTSPGRLTAQVRHKLGLNTVLGDSGEKNRNDHRHHSIDALVVGVMDRSFLQKAAKHSEENIKEIEFADPWNNFRNDVVSAVDGIVVSHRVEHGNGTRFLEETCYGYRKPENAEVAKKGWRLTSRKSLENLKEKDLERIVSPHLREIALRDGLTALDKMGAKKVKVFEVCLEDDEIIGSPSSYVFRKKHGKEKQHSSHYFKDGTYRMTYWRLPNGRYEPVFQYYFDTQSKKNVEASLESIKPHPAAKLVLKLHLGDMVVLKRGEKEVICRVQTIKPKNNQVGFLEINKGKKEEEEKDFLLATSRLLPAMCRRVYISPAGNMIDRGPKS